VGFLIDTNVLSELRKRERANANVVAWMKRARDADLYLSVLVVGEIRRGIERIRGRDGAQADAIEHWLAEVTTTFGARVLPISSAIAEAWGRMSASNPPPVVDGLLAATAKVHGLTLVTRNVADVARTGVTVVNPFEP
jgi:hypothetical protein